MEEIINQIKSLNPVVEVTECEREPLEVEREFCFSCVYSAHCEDHDGSGMMHPTLGPTGLECERTQPKVSPKRGLGSSDHSQDGLWERAEGHARHFVSVWNGLSKITNGSVLEVSIPSLTRRLVDLASESPLEKVIKWFYGASLSIVTGDTVPPCPVATLASRLRGASPQTVARKIGRWFWGESFGRKISNGFFRAFSRFQGGPKKKLQALSFGKTLLNAKKGSPVVPEELKDETAKKHREALTNRQKGLHAAKREIIDVEASALDDEILREITRSVEELFTKPFNPKEGLAPFPSFSGHFFNDRSKGGACGTILQNWRNSMRFSTDLACNRSATVMVEMEEGTREFKHYKGTLPRFFRAIGDSLAKEAEWGSPALPVQILEPLKVRTVTCGSDTAYWLLKEVQDWMWRSIKVNPAFELIGTPITAEILQTLIDKDPKYRRPLTAFLSGDYSAATDNLRRFYPTTPGLRSVAAEVFPVGWRS